MSHEEAPSQNSESYTLFEKWWVEDGQYTYAGMAMTKERAYQLSQEYAKWKWHTMWKLSTHLGDNN